jgi:hypothetical protein
VATTGDVVDMGASSFNLLQYARNTTDTICKLKGMLALVDRNHKQDIANAYASIQAMLNQLTPTVLSNKAAVVECTKTIKELPDRVANAVLPKIAATINSTRNDLSLTMASTMTLASNIFGAKMDEAILRLNEFGRASQTETISTITDSLDQRLVPITTTLSSLEAKVAALNATTTTILPVTPDASASSPPTWGCLVIDTTSPPPPEVSMATAPTGSKLFPNVDPSKLFPQRDVQPYNPTYCASYGQENDHESASTLQGRQNGAGLDPDHHRGPGRSTLPLKSIQAIPHLDC